MQILGLKFTLLPKARHFALLPLYADFGKITPPLFPGYAEIRILGILPT